MDTITLEKTATTSKRQTDRKTDRRTDRQIDKQAKRQPDRPTERQTGRLTDWQTDRETERDTHRYTVQTHRQTDIYRQTNGQMGRKVDQLTNYLYNWKPLNISVGESVVRPTEAQTYARYWTGLRQTVAGLIKQIFNRPAIGRTNWKKGKEKTVVFL